MSGSYVGPDGRVYAHTNPYALGRQTSKDFDYNVAQNAPEYPWPEIAAFAEPDANADDNGYIDNPAAAGAGRAGSNHGSIYTLPQRGDPSYVVHQTDGTGTQEQMDYSTTDVTSAQRVESIPLFDRRPSAPNSRADNSPGMVAPDQWWRGQGIGGTPAKDRSIVGGEDLEEINRPMNPFPYATGQRRWADSPRRAPIDSDRPRGHQSPDGWRFMRPFDQFNRPYEDEIVGSSRRFTGNHFSMADHRREYDVLGMRPARSYRNTYRIEPAPWDEANTDQVPMYAQPTREAQYNIYGSSRSYRLG